MLPGWMAEKVGGSHVMVSPRVAAERRRRKTETDLGRGSTARISNGLRPQDPGGGEVQLTSISG